MLKPIKPISRNKFFILAVLWTVFVLTASLMPVHPPGKLPEQSDKLVHVFFFALLYFFWNRTRLFHAISLLVYLVLFGIIIEILQGILPFGRHFDWLDVLADFFGIILIYFIRDNNK